jgi:hypothetical protein
VSEYRGFQYVIRARGRNRWDWEIYQAGSTIGCGKGRLLGSRHEAMRAAENAIDRWVEKQSQPDPLPSANLSRENAERIWNQIRRFERLAERTPHALEKRSHEASIAHLKKQLPVIAS